MKIYALENKKKTIWQQNEANLSSCNDNNCSMVEMYFE